MTKRGVFELERIGETLILNLRKGMQETDITEATEVLEYLKVACINDVVVDCHDLDFLRSTGLGFFVTIANRLKGSGGQLVFCNVSPKGRQVLHATRLDQVWAICETREAALDQVRDGAA